MPAHTGRPDQAELSRTPAIPARPTLPVDRIHIGAMPRVRRGSHNRPQARRPRHAGKHGVADVGRRPSQKPRRVTTLSVCKAARYRTATGPRGPAACPKPAVGEPPSAHVAGRCQRWGDYRQRDWSSLSGPAAAPSQVGHSPVRRAGRRYTGSPPPAAPPPPHTPRPGGLGGACPARPRPPPRSATLRLDAPAAATLAVRLRPPYPAPTGRGRRAAIGRTAAFRARAAVR